MSHTRVWNRTHPLLRRYAHETKSGSSWDLRLTRLDSQEHTEKMSNTKEELTILAEHAQYVLSPVLYTMRNKVPNPGWPANGGIVETSQPSAPSAHHDPHSMVSPKRPEPWLNSSVPGGWVGSRFPSPSWRCWQCREPEWHRPVLRWKHSTRRMGCRPTCRQWSLRWRARNSGSPHCLFNCLNCRLICRSDQYQLIMSGEHDHRITKDTNAKGCARKDLGTKMSTKQHYNRQGECEWTLKHFAGRPPSENPEAVDMQIERYAIKLKATGMNNKRNSTKVHENSKPETTEGINTSQVMPKLSRHKATKEKQTAHPRQKRKRHKSLVIRQDTKWYIMDTESL